jgi:histidinol phosphatase-like enzyme
MGKPEPFLLDAIADEHRINKERTLMVGDRLDTGTYRTSKGFRFSNEQESRFQLSLSNINVTGGIRFEMISCALH